MYRKIERSLVAGDEHGVFIEREISFSQGARAYVVDFNYHYLAVSRLRAGQWDEVTPLRWDLNGYTLYLQKKELDKRNIILLEIKNLQELTDQGIELTEIVRMIKEEGEKKE